MVKEGPGVRIDSKWMMQTSAVGLWFRTSNMQQRVELDAISYTNVNSLRSGSCSRCCPYD